MDLKLEQEFFNALVGRDVAALDRLLADDFTLADLTGSLIDKKTLQTLVQQGVMEFVSYATQGGQRRLVAAQGTPIRAPEDLL